jgi:serine-type D-Ala-D-Ala carboxypeptidase
MKLQPGTPEEAGMSAQRVQHVINLAHGWVEQGVTPALVSLVARRGVIVAHEAFGRLGPEPDAPPLKPGTIFPVDSIAKPITATAAMILVEEGLLSLNRPVVEYLPEFAGEGKAAVKVHHLLTHTSGLRDEEVYRHIAEKKGTVDIPPPDATQHPFINEHLFLGYDTPLRKPPGVELVYSSYGYNLVSEIIRRVSRQSLADFTQKRIFEPLGMTDTYFIVPDEVRPRIVRRSPEVQFNTFLKWLTLEEFEKAPIASSAAYSTVNDLAIFGQMFLNRGSYGETRVLSPASVAEMTRNQLSGVGGHVPGSNELLAAASWGYGWHVKANDKSGTLGSLSSAKTFSHGGIGGVFTWADPVYELVGVYFSINLRRDLAQHDLFMDAVTAAVVEV